METKVEKNTEYMLKNFENAKHFADVGELDAKIEVGFCYKLGEGVEKNTKEAIRYFLKAADHMVANDNLTNPEIGQKHLKKTLDAQLQLRAYCFGKSALSAEECFQEAADAGSPAAQFNLALSYDFGDRIEQDTEKALHYYTLAAIQNFPMAQVNLGCHFHKKFLKSKVQSDMDEALRYYHLAAAMKLPDALNNLADCYKNGVGVAKDPAKVVEYRRIAADWGDICAQCLLGEYYEAGEFGLEINVELAQKYFQLSAAQGDHHAVLGLRRLGAESFDSDSFEESCGSGSCDEDSVPEIEVGQVTITWEELVTKFRNGNRITMFPLPVEKQQQSDSTLPPPQPK